MCPPNFGPPNFDVSPELLPELHAGASVYHNQGP